MVLTQISNIYLRRMDKFNELVQKGWTYSREIEHHERQIAAPEGGVEYQKKQLEEISR